jgi:hypothetical protein
MILFIIIFILCFVLQIVLVALLKGTNTDFIYTFFGRLLSSLGIVIVTMFFIIGILIVKDMLTTGESLDIKRLINLILVNSLLAGYFSFKSLKER